MKKARIKEKRRRAHVQAQWRELGERAARAAVRQIRETLAADKRREAQEEEEKIMKQHEEDKKRRESKKALQKEGYDSSRGMQLRWRKKIQAWKGTREIVRFEAMLQSLLSSPEIQSADKRRADFHDWRKTRHATSKFPYRHRHANRNSSQAQDGDDSSPGQESSPPLQTPVDGAAIAREEPEDASFPEALSLCQCCFASISETELQSSNSFCQACQSISSEQVPVPSEVSENGARQEKHRVLRLVEQGIGFLESKKRSGKAIALTPALLASVGHLEVSICINVV